MTYSRRIRLVPIWVAIAIALVIALAVSLAMTKPAGAVVDEITAALCNGGAPLHPKGQAQGAGFIKSLLGSGFITSLDFSDPPNLTVNFDPDVPASKFRSVGFDVTIAGAAPGGGDLILSPGIEPDPDFAAHANCPLFGTFTP